MVIYVPGMMYVNDLRPDSICDTALEFLMMNSSYWPNHFTGALMALKVEAVAWRMLSISPDGCSSVHGNRKKEWRGVASEEAREVRWLDWP